MTKALTTPSSGPQLGLERGRPEDLILPHVLLLQPTSKHVTQKDMKAGSCINSLTEKPYEVPIEFIPVVYHSFYNVYHYEGTGAKAKKIWEFRTDNKEDSRLAGRRWKGDDNGKREIEPVMRFLSLVAGEPAVLDFSKSSIQGGKKLYTLARLSRANLFSNIYKLTINKESNDQGTFYVKDVEPLGPAGKPEYDQAHELFQAFGGKVEAVAPAEEEVPF